MTYGFSLHGELFKAHGHGNDYLVFQEGDGWPVTPSSIRLLCHRNRGIGADGIVALLGDRAPEGHERNPGPRSLEGGPSPFRLRMFNPDGTEFERSGNGLRVLGAFLLSRGLVEMGRPFSVEVGGDGLEMEILRTGPGGVLDVEVHMGKARFGTDAVEADPARLGEGTTLQTPEGALVPLHLVSVGNPHCVVFVEELTEEDFVGLGPFLVGHQAFPNGTNVQVARILGPGEVEIRIWERGVGRTASSGTSACAVAASAVHSGRLPPGRIRVVMEGGSFRVTVSRDRSVRLEGPVEPVMDGRLAPGLLAALRRGPEGS